MHHAYGTQKQTESRALAAEQWPWFQKLQVAYLHFDQVTRHAMHLKITVWVAQIRVYLLHCDCRSLTNTMWDKERMDAVLGCVPKLVYLITNKHL